MDGAGAQDQAPGAGVVQAASAAGGAADCGPLADGGGVFGFLPVIGFWMLPLGVAVAALDVVPILRWLGLWRWRRTKRDRKGRH